MGQVVRLKRGNVSDVPASPNRFIAADPALPSKMRDSVQKMTAAGEFLKMKVDTVLVNLARIDGILNSVDDLAVRIMLRARLRHFRQTLVEAERSLSVELRKIASLSEAIEF